jgi:hypothetical protein
MPRTAHRLSPSVLGVGISLFCIFGCGSTDERLVALSEKSVIRQAEQNQQMLEQSTQIAQATRQLVAADAQAREELIAVQARLQHDLQAEREGIDRNRDELEAERKDLATHRHRDPLIAAAIIQAATLLACLLPIFLCLAILRALRHEATDPALDEVLIRELVAPHLLPPETGLLATPLLENHSQPAASASDSAERF